MFFNKRDFFLRTMNEDDRDTILRWRNSERVRRNMFTDHIITPEEHRIWFDNILSKNNAKYFIFEYQGRSIGQSNAVDIDHLNSKCYWGFYIGELEVPHGVGAAMGYFTLLYIFKKIGIRKICSEILSFNSASISLHRRLGFETDGYLRNHVVKNNKPEDVICMILFKKKWKLIKKKMENKLFSE